MNEEIKNRLIEVRNHFGESVYSFAKKLSIPQPTLQRYEREERKIANKLLLSLVNTFNVNINWLLTGKGTMFIKDDNNSFSRHNDENVQYRLSNAGKRLVHIQEKNNFLDREMAKLLKISEKEYLKLVTGELNFNIYIINNIKQNFIVDIDWLLYGENE